MKNRRNFLTSLAGLLSLPFISKAEAKPKYNLAVDPPGTANDPDHHSEVMYVMLFNRRTAEVKYVTYPSRSAGSKHHETSRL